MWVEGEAAVGPVWHWGGFHGGDGIGRIGPSGREETGKLNIVGGGNSKGKCSARRVGWCVCLGTLGSL